MVILKIKILRQFHIFKVKMALTLITEHFLLKNVVSGDYDM